MKSIRNISIAILLSLLFAGWNWQAARAPESEGIVVLSSPTPIFIKEDGKQQTPAIPNDPPIPTVTVIPEDVIESPEITVTVPPENTIYSCSNGAVGSGAFVWPTDNHSLTGMDYGTGHPGIDIAAGEGSPVYAADAGFVIAEGNDVGGYGKVIQIDHGNGYLTVYAHLSVIEVRMCQSVVAGQRIGAAGSTGNARGAHLHFEVAKDGWHINPWDVLP
jgi:murein DD-endopeptidase MepM/ murein hydrolase activator NlpD